MVNLRAAQQCLSRDATPIETDAAQLIALDQCCLHAELCRADRRHVAARAAAENDQVEGSLRHRAILWPPLTSYSSIVSGSSTSFLKAARNCAPTAPSTARWSQESVQLITVATASAPFLTTGRCSPAPTARMPPCGGLMTAAKSRTPYMPGFAIENVPP